MSDVAVRVENLGKRYRIGARQKRANTLRERLGSLAASPFDYLRSTLRGPSEEEVIWALKDVSFEVKQGEVVGIIGRNGAGKTTLLKILSRITEPTEGRAIINGRVGSLLEVGTGFHPELTGRENIYLNGAILGMKRAEIDRKFDEIVDFSGVEKFIDTPVKRYSSGMYVRLAFAVAAHLEPEILLVDEVLAVGDAEFQKKCLGKIGDVAIGGRTVLFVSHNLGALEAICSDALLLDQGHIVQRGKTSDVIRFYLNMLGAQSGERYHVSSRKLIWKGISNRNGLDNLRPDSDLDFILEFEAGDDDIDDFHIDCALFNERNENVIHTKSKFVIDGLSASKQEKFRVKYSIKSPKLAPGSYYMTLYVYSNDDGEVLFWADTIDACRVIATSYFGRAEILDGLRSAIIPEFGVELLR